MQLPKRRSQMLLMRDNDATVPLTAEAIERLQQELDRLEHRDQPRAIEDVSQAVQKGDLSENAEYQEARARLSRIQARIFSLKDRLKRAVVIDTASNAGGRAALGSTVVVSVNGLRKLYCIVGPHESNPARGYVSHLSPLGSALIGHAAGDTVTIETPNGTVIYTLLEIK